MSEFHRVSRDSETLPTAFENIKSELLVTDNKIRTDDFLNASKGVVTLVERFGKVFSPVTYDMNGNIRKLTDKYAENPELHYYLEDMILLEKENGGLVATDALLWLRRALQFITVFFQMIIDDTVNDTITDDLTSFIKRAYSETLERYHGWLGTQLFNVLSRFVPSRQSLFFKLALEEYNRNDYVIKDMHNFNKNMSVCVNRLTEFYEEHGLENEVRV